MRLSKRQFQNYRQHVKEVTTKITRLDKLLQIRRHVTTPHSLNSGLSVKVGTTHLFRFPQVKSICV